MKKLSKKDLKPVSELGFNDKLRICYNCQWRKKETGWCSLTSAYVPYNNSGVTCKLFRYIIGGPYHNWWFDEIPNPKNIIQQQ